MWPTRGLMRTRLHGADDQRPPPPGQVHASSRPDTPHSPAGVPNTVLCQLRTHFATSRFVQSSDSRLMKALRTVQCGAGLSKHSQSTSLLLICWHPPRSNLSMTLSKHAHALPALPAHPAQPDASRRTAVQATYRGAYFSTHSCRSGPCSAPEGPSWPSPGPSRSSCPPGAAAAGTASPAAAAAAAAPQPSAGEAARCCASRCDSSSARSTLHHVPRGRKGGRQALSGDEMGGGC
jgi:hypothetical protein